MQAHRRLVNHAVALGVTVVLAGCAASSTQGPSMPPASVPGPASSSELATVAPTNEPSPSPTPVEASAGQVLGSGTYPTYTVVLPPKWAALGHFVVKNPAHGQVLGLSVWDVGQVPLDPCLWKSTLRTPAAGVDGLVKTLLSQKGRTPSAPVKVELAGQSGTYLEWSTPEWVVTGDADFAGCDDPGNGHHDFVSWFATDQQGERYEQVAGQVDQLWILDVHGQRLVVDATFAAGTSAADRAELASVVASLRFVAP